MFDHLTPPKDIKIRRSRNNTIDLFIYFSLLLWAIFLGVFSNLSKYSPSAIAFYSTPNIDITISEVENKDISIYIPKLTLFNFNIKTINDGTKLDELKIYLNGLYSEELYNSLREDLKLYSNNTQLGSIVEIDKNGFIYFDIGKYSLSYGDNLFSLVLSNHNLEINNILQFSIQNKEDIKLSYNKNVFYSNSEFPLLGNLFNFTDKGYINVYNLDNINNVQLSNTEISISNFIIASEGESIAINKLVINAEDIDGTFFLKNDNKLISTGIVEDNKIIFNLNNFKLNQNKDSYFEITGILEEGNYSFSLENIYAKGFFSGQEINTKEYFLNEVEIKDSFLLFSTNYLNNKIVGNWNILYDINIKSLGKEIELDKLVWDFKGDISDINILIDNEYKETDITLKNDKLTTEWNNLVIPKEGINMKIIANTEGVDYIQIFLLENSIVDYNLPNFPLEPNILTR